MTQTFDTVINEVVTVLKTVSGIQQVPVNPKETMNSTLFALVFAEEGIVHNSPVGQRVAQIAIYLMRKRMDIANDLAVLRPFTDSIPTALKAQVDPGGNRFNQSIQEFANTTFKYETLEYAGVDYACYHFIMHDVTTTVP